MQYTGRVFVGFWLDKLQLDLEKREKQDEKRKRGELPCQRSRRIFRAFTVPLSLSPPSDHLQYGHRLQLHAPEILDSTYRLQVDRGCPKDEVPTNPHLYGLIVAATAAKDEWRNEAVKGIQDGCAVACTPVSKPAARNVFMLVKCREPCAGLVRFGEEFFIQLYHGSEKLYLRSETPLVDGQFGPNYHNPVRLNVTTDCYAKWRAVHWNRHKRFETEGDPVPPCARIVIQHVMSGQCLAAEHLNWHRSLFGFECGISVHTYSDVHRNETSECIWNMIIDGSCDDHKDKCEIKRLCTNT